MTVPPRLVAGSGVRVVAPSRSLQIVGKRERDIARARLEALGLKVSLATHVGRRDAFASSSVEHRVRDLKDAFEDPSVHLLHTAIGGFNSNQLLRHLPYRSIERNPKALCGYSDITALQHAILARTGLVSFSGPHFSTFGMLKGFDHIGSQFHQALFGMGRWEVPPSRSWSDDRFYHDQEHRRFHRRTGPWVLHPGRARGRVLGGNLCTLNLLQGTEYLPDLEGSILFVEDCDEDGTPEYFDRNLQSVLHLPSARGIQALLIGRFESKSRMTRELLRRIVESKPELSDIPVVADLDFGHTYPMFTFPIGGHARVRAGRGRAQLTLSLDGAD